MKKNRFASASAMLALATFGFFVLCFAVHPASPLHTHLLADPDDYMRLNQVISWMKGQGWYDLSVPRIAPGGNAVIHWSRLIDLPIALIAWPLVPVFGISDAVLISSFIAPLLWFSILLTLVFALASEIVGPARAGLACAMTLFAPPLTFNFSPGRVDHHGVQVLIAGFGLLCLIRILRGNKGALFAALAALAFACGFWVRIEALPWAILFIACLGAAAAWQKDNVARDAAIFGALFPLFTAALIPVALPPREYTSLAISWFSPAHVILAALAGSVLVIGWIKGKDICCRAGRLSIYAILGLVSLGAFFALVPSARRGPFADYTLFDSTRALDNISEAQPLANALQFNRYMPLTIVSALVNFLYAFALPLLALGASLYAAWKTEKERRLIWIAQAVFLASAMGLAVFWQLRVSTYMWFFSIVPLTWMLFFVWGRLRQKFQGRALFMAEIGVFLILGPLPIVIVPALAHRTSLRDVVLFPVPNKVPECSLEAVLPFLNDPERLGATTLTIMNDANSGPEILFRTRHNVVSGHYNLPSNQDAYTFFSATTDAPSLVTAKKWGADAVLVCKKTPKIYFDADYYALGRLRLMPGKDGMLHFSNADASQPLIERLIRGQYPKWLEPVELFGASDYLLFKIKYPKRISNDP